MAPTPQEFHHILIDLLNDAINRLDRDLGNIYTSNFQRLALRQFILRHVFRETEFKLFPLEDFDLMTMRPIAESLAESFLDRYATELGWTVKTNMLSDTGADHKTHEAQLDLKLRGHLVAIVVQLFQMNADAGEWMELYESVLRDAVAKDALTTSKVILTTSRLRARRADGEELEIHSEPETSTTATRPKMKVKRTRSFTSRLNRFVNGDCGIDGMMKDMNLGKGKAEQMAEAAHDDGSLEDSSPSKSSTSDAGGRVCEFCDRVFKSKWQLIDHIQKHFDE